MAIYPEPVFQLTPKTAYSNVNCGPTCAVMALDHATYGAVQTTPNEIRKRGSMGDGPTDLLDLKRGVAAYAPEANAAGYVAPNLVRLGYIPYEQLLMTLVRKRAFHIIALRYQLVTDPYRNDDYLGGHFVCATRLYRPYGVGFIRVKPYQLAGMGERALARLHTKVFDPLADGRWSGDLQRRVAVAPQMWPVNVLFAAGDGFNDIVPRDGRLAAAVIYRAARLP